MNGQFSMIVVKLNAGSLHQGTFQQRLFLMLHFTMRCFDLLRCSLSTMTDDTSKFFEIVGFMNIKSRGCGSGAIRMLLIFRRETAILKRIIPEMASNTAINRV